MKEKSKVTQIVLDLKEGPVYRTGIICFSGVDTTDTYLTAQHQLTMWGYDAPAIGEGYTKCEATIKWDNGDSLHVRYDLQKYGHTQGHSTLRAAIKSKLEIYAGVKCPDHLKDHIKDLLASDPKFTEGMKRILATCEV
jgi:hypothetical protein